MSTSKPELQRQLDQIAQESTSNVVEVIVQMESARTDLKKLGRAAAESLRRRRMSLSSRDVLPSNYSADKNASPKIASQSASTRTLLGKAAAEAFSLKTIQKMGTDSMKQLRTTSVFDASMARMTKPSSKSAGDRPEPKPFWTSRAMPMQLTKMELQELATIANVKSVNVNRKLHLPPMMESNLWRPKPTTFCLLLGGCLP